MFLLNSSNFWQDIAEIVYTVRDVIDEIKDQATKQRLRVLPYEIKMMEPSSEAVLKGTGLWISLNLTISS